MNRLYALIAGSLVVGAIFYNGSAALGRAAAGMGSRIVCRTKTITVAAPSVARIPPTVPPTTPPSARRPGKSQVQVMAVTHPAAPMQTKPKLHTTKITVCKNVPAPAPAVIKRTTVVVVRPHPHPPVAAEQTVVPAPEPSAVVETQQSTIVETPEPAAPPEVVAFESPAPTPTIPAPAAAAPSPPLAATGSLAPGGAAGTSALAVATYLYIRSRRRLRDSAFSSKIAAPTTDSLE
jgi:hypothetical protein